MLTEALLFALGKLAERVTGAASDRLLEAAKVQAGKLQGLLRGNAEEQAQALFAHVRAEAAAYPPQRALRVESLATLDEVGIWPPNGRLRLQLRWTNHADFPVLVRDVVVKAKVGAKDPEWELRQGDEFRIEARNEQLINVSGDAVIELPEFARAGVSCELWVEALVAGPWEGEAQRTRELLHTSMWLPVYIERSDLLTDEADIDLAIEHHMFWLRSKRYQEYRISYDHLDKELKLKPGSAKARLLEVAKKGGHKITTAPTIAVITPNYSRNFEYEHDPEVEEKKKQSLYRGY
jgi:hypothetical protein